MHNRQRIGERGEHIVKTNLVERGFMIVGHNLHSRFGELDIVAEHAGTMHIIEVKTRTSIAFGHPIETLTRAKLQKMKKTVYDLQLKGTLPNKRYQIDFAAVLMEEGEEPVIEWFLNVGMQDLV